jgi:hypothetical protein
MSTGIEQETPTTPPPPPPGGALPPAKPNPWQRIVGVLLSPTETFRSIVQQPDWVVPLLLIVFMTIAGTIVVATHVDFVGPIRAQMLEQNPNMTPEQVERPLRFAGMVAKGAMMLTPVISIGTLVVIAAILLVAMRMFGGEGEFKAAFSVTLYAWMPSVILSAITCIVLLTRGQVPIDQIQALVRSNLGFLADPKSEPVLFALFVSLDIFTVWVITLLVIGFAEISKLTRAKVATIVVSLWAFLILFKIGFASLGALMKAKARA